jgi:transposase
MSVGDADARLQVRHEGSDYRRVEVITGRRRRRSWTAGEKAAMVAASAEPGANISEVARRFGVNRGLLTVWRRQAGLASWSCPAPEFVPVMVGDAGAGDMPKEMPAPTASREGGRIELELDGARLAITGDVDPDLAAAVVRVLWATGRPGRR